jgi:hypothetical protein
MTTIDATDALALLLGAASGFEERWQLHLEHWGQAPRGLCIDVAELVVHVEERIKGDNTGDLGGLFEVVERLLAQGDDYVRDAVATCFVESLVNRVPESISDEALAKLLGPRATEQAQAWNDFWGVKRTSQRSLRKASRTNSSSGS